MKALLILSALVLAGCRAGGTEPTYIPVNGLQLRDMCVASPAGGEPEAVGFCIGFAHAVAGELSARAAEEGLKWPCAGPLTYDELVATAQNAASRWNNEPELKKADARRTLATELRFAYGEACPR